MAVAGRLRLHAMMAMNPLGSGLSARVLGNLSDTGSPSTEAGGRRGYELRAGVRGTRPGRDGDVCYGGVGRAAHEEGLVPKRGVEPPHPYGYLVLNQARLPFRHFGT